MTPVFGDTYYWIALTLPDDEAHSQAHEVVNDIVTTEEVLTEYLTFFSQSPQRLRRLADTNVDAILDTPSVRVIPASHESFIAGLELYRSRPDKGYSLTDCISMQVMRRERLSEALTNDRHFEQEGFHAIFR